MWTCSRCGANVGANWGADREPLCLSCSQQNAESGSSTDIVKPQESDVPATDNLKEANSARGDGNADGQQNNLRGAEMGFARPGIVAAILVFLPILMLAGWIENYAIYLTSNSSYDEEVARFINAKLIGDVGFYQSPITWIAFAISVALVGFTHRNEIPKASVFFVALITRRETAWLSLIGTCLLMAYLSAGPAIVGWNHYPLTLIGYLGCISLFTSENRAGNLQKLAWVFCYETAVLIWILQANLIPISPDNPNSLVVGHFFLLLLGITSLLITVFPGRNFQNAVLPAAVLTGIYAWIVFHEGYAFGCLVLLSSLPLFVMATCSISTALRQGFAIDIEGVGESSGQTHKNIDQPRFITMQSLVGVALVSAFSRWRACITISMLP